jgi:CRISPR type III-A-associated protein Csm2
MNGRNQPRPDQARRSPDDRKVPPPIPRERVEAILNHSAEDIDSTGQQIARECRGLPRTQMRNFYGPIVRLRSDLASNPSREPRPEYANALMMHRARLVYMAARPDGRHAEALARWFAELVITAVRNNRVEAGKVEAICDLAEAIVAYHYASTVGAASR